MTKLSKSLPIILIILSVLISCRGKEIQIDSYSLKEDSLIYGLVDSLIMPDSIWRKLLLVPPPLFPKDYSKKELKRRRDSLIQLWDTAKLFIAFDDTLILFSKLHHTERYKNTKEYFKYNLENIDSSFYELFARLVLDTTLNERFIDYKRIHTNYNYKIIPIDSVEIIRSKKLRLVEINKFSRIIFNKTFDKACFYGQSICGRLCGEGYLIFLEKLNGNWKIVERKSLWVS
jgi:hypothetical protein